VEPGPLQQRGQPVALLVLEGGPRVVTNDPAEGSGEAETPWPAAAIARGADAGVTTEGTGLLPGTSHLSKTVLLEECTHRLVIQLLQLLRVPQVAGTGSQVRRGLLPV
jgi:hypothetical protein